MGCPYSSPRGPDTSTSSPGCRAARAVAMGPLAGPAPRSRSREPRAAGEEMGVYLRYAEKSRERD